MGQKLSPNRGQNAQKTHPETRSENRCEKRGQTEPRHALGSQFRGPGLPGGGVRGGSTALEGGLERKISNCWGSNTPWARGPANFVFRSGSQQCFVYVLLFPTTLVFGSPFLLPLSTPDSTVGKLVFPRASATRIHVIVVIVIIVIIVIPLQKG